MQEHYHTFDASLLLSGDATRGAPARHRGIPINPNREQQQHSQPHLSVAVVAVDLRADGLCCS